jgi:alpha-beta hydrolase superfamily lysophospholipase
MAIMTRGRMAATLLSIGLISAACGSSVPTPAATGGEIPAAPTTTDPRSVVGRDFYTAPPTVPGEHAGDLVRYQKIEASVPTGGVPYDAWRILYRSEAADGDAPIAVSGLILAPKEASARPRPIIAWAHQTVGSADVCAPSRTFTGKPVTTLVEEATFLDQTQHFLRQGYVIVATDYEGLGTDGQHPFLVGESAGRSVLDAVTAARQIAALNTSDTVVVYGLSQGGHAALFAGQLAAERTPALKIAGVVAAAPFSEIDQLLPLAATVPDLAHYYMLGVYGMAAGTSKLNPVAVLDPAARAQGSLIERQCLSDLSTSVRGILQTAGKTSLMTTDPMTLPDWKAALEATVPGKTPTGAPILVVQGANDTRVPAATTKTLVKRLCGSNGRVQYVEYAEAGHGDVIKSADRDIKAFVNNRLSGAPFTPTC